MSPRAALYEITGVDRTPRRAQCGLASHTPPTRQGLLAETIRSASHQPQYPNPRAAPRAREPQLGLPQSPRANWRPSGSWSHPPTTWEILRDLDLIPRPNVTARPGPGPPPAPPARVRIALQGTPAPPCTVRHSATTPATTAVTERTERATSTSDDVIDSAAYSTSTHHAAWAARMEFSAPSVLSAGSEALRPNAQPAWRSHL